MQHLATAEPKNGLYNMLQKLRDTTAYFKLQNFSLQSATETFEK